MGCHWFLRPPVHDIIAVSIQADVQWVLHLSHVLLMALPAINHVHGVLHLAGGCSSYVEGSSGGYAHEGGASPDVAASETASGSTAAGSSGWLN